MHLNAYKDRKRDVIEDTILEVDAELILRIYKKTLEKLLQKNNVEYKAVEPLFKLIVFSDSKRLINYVERIFGEQGRQRILEKIDYENITQINQFHANEIRSENDEKATKRNTDEVLCTDKQKDGTNDQ